MVANREPGSYIYIYIHQIYMFPFFSALGLFALCHLFNRNRFGIFSGSFAVQVWCVPKLAEDVAPDDYTKANKDGFADKIDEIREEPQTLNILELFFS